ncbi:hypothetical protein NADFUDRAFT_53168 [Nadsonia fulvescens var. elongata DSM 6958]|uniref:Endosomal peripheral membrane protein n=1 Tax=Nadsonia fulvescens var. elongata DSM 6958 TaxID=857566 RepID=A0A1E3PDH6_9ASCO|nr:hypothetical protein NADFUDRAFT_53168 [Nadsonia fulvescens var. elongata DSM 6958]
MSTVNLLTSELTNLISEAKRRNVELRQSAETSLDVLKGFNGTNEDLFLHNLADNQAFITPFLISCSTRNAKYSAIAVQCLHRLISARGLPVARLDEVLGAFEEATHLGFDIQLKILQSLPSLIRYYADDMTGELIARLLHICSILQSATKMPVVINTAAATLQQIIISIFDKIVTEDQKDTISLPRTFEVPIDNGEKILVSPATYDALRVLYDLCALCEKQKPKLTQFTHLQETFGLELIESILTNHSQVFLRHVELSYVLRTRIIPLMLRAFSERRDFAITVRVTRILYLLLRTLLPILVVECEVMLSLLSHMLDPEAAPLWKRCLCMEVFQGVCSEYDLVKSIYTEFDSKPDKKNVIQDFVATLKSIISERPDLLGNGDSQQIKAGRSNPQTANSASSLALSSTGTLNSLTSANISTEFSIIKVPCIDHLDKNEPPTLPGTYIYYLALTCANYISEGLARFILSLSTNNSGSQTENPKQKRKLAKNSLLINPLSIEKQSQRQDVMISDSLVRHCWEDLLYVYSIFLNSSLDPELYHALVRSIQKFAHVAGLLEITDSRDAYMAILGQYSVTLKHANKPSTSKSGSNLETATALASGSESGASRKLSTVNNIVLSGVGSLVSSLSPNVGGESTNKKEEGSLSVSNHTMVATVTPNNTFCLRALLNLAVALGPTLGTTWFVVLETLQIVDSILGSKTSGISFNGRKTSVASTSSSVSRSKEGVIGDGTNSGSGNSGAEFSIVENSIKRLFESSVNYSDSAFFKLIKALLCLSAKTLGVSDSTLASEWMVKNSSKYSEQFGINSKWAIELGEPLFCIQKIGLLAELNISRLATTVDDSDLRVWDSIVDYSIKIGAVRDLSSDVRIHTTSVLNKIIKKAAYECSNRKLKAQGTLTAVKLEHLGRVERRNLETLCKEVQIISALPLVSDGSTAVTSAEAEIHRAGLETLYNILDQCGGTIDNGWDTIFKIINSAFDWTSAIVDIKLHNKKSLVDRSVKLIRMAFESVQLVCNDFLVSLPQNCLLTLIDTLYRFCHQVDDLNISFTSISFFWTISDYLKIAINKFPDDIAEPLVTKKMLVDKLTSDLTVSDHMMRSDAYFALWFILLLRLAAIASDSRQEVRNGAIQILFRIFDSYGELLKINIWKSCQAMVLPAIMSVQPRIEESIDAPGGQEFDNAQSQWADTMNLITSGFSGLFISLENVPAEDIENFWNHLIQYYSSVVEIGDPNLSLSVYKSINQILEYIKCNQGLFGKLPDSFMLTAWRFLIDQSVTANLDNANSNQESVTALVECYDPLYHFTQQSVSNSVIIESLSLLDKCMSIPVLPAFCSDRESMTSLQSAIMTQVKGFDLKDNVELASHVFKILARFAVLPILTNNSTSSTQTVNDTKAKYFSPSFIAVAVNSLVNLRDKLTHNETAAHVQALYDNGILLNLLEQLLELLKRKFDPPLISPTGANAKLSGDLQLWQLATNVFISIVRMVKPQLSSENNSSVKPKFWQVIMTGLSYTLGNGVEVNIDLTQYPHYEVFDIQAYGALREIVYPIMGAPYLMDEVIDQYLRSIFTISFLYEMKEENDRLALKELDPQRGLDQVIHRQVRGNTTPVVSRPRQALGRHCLEELFCLSSSYGNHSHSNEYENKWSSRIAHAALVYLLWRAGFALTSYAADQKLRGKMPMPKIQRIELLYLLRGLLDLSTTADHILRDHLSRLYPLLAQAIAISYRDRQVLVLLERIFDQIGHVYAIGK